jgi:hypothetical protein
MKSFIFFVVLGLTISSYAQDKTIKQAREGLMKVEELPAVVIKELELIFSLYSDNHPDKEVRRMQEKFIATILVTIKDLKIICYL